MYPHPWLGFLPKVYAVRLERAVAKVQNHPIAPGLLTLSYLQLPELGALQRHQERCPLRFSLES